MDGWMESLNTELYQIKTYKLKFALHEIRTIPNYMQLKACRALVIFFFAYFRRTEVKARRARGEEREKI